MKFRLKSILYFFIIASLVIGCNIKKELSKDKPSSKNKTKMEIVKINSLSQSEYKIKLGQQISYSFREHGSVGISAEYALSDGFVLALKERNKVYSNPDRKHMSGADNSTVTLVFEAEEIGTCDIIIKKMFRGNIENELKFKVTVE